MYVDGDGEVFIANTAGVRGSFRAGQCYAFAYVLAEQEGQVETGYSYSVGPQPSRTSTAAAAAPRPPPARRACWGRRSARR